MDLFNKKKEPHHHQEKEEKKGGVGGRGRGEGGRREMAGDKFYHFSGSSDIWARRGRGGVGAVGGGGGGGGGGGVGGRQRWKMKAFWLGKGDGEGGVGGLPRVFEQVFFYYYGCCSFISFN